MPGDRGAHTTSDDPRAARHGALRAAAALAGVFVAVAIPLWLIGHAPVRVAGDQNDYHLVAISRFAPQWPLIVVRAYESATTPGYHWALAGLKRAGLEPTIALQVAASVFTIGLLGTLGWVCARRARAIGGGGPSLPWRAVAFALPIACSPYVIQSGAWLLPDNAAWWGVLVMVALALSPAGGTRRWLITSGAVLCALVLVRQNHIWTAGVLLAAAWLGRADPTDEILGHPPLSRRDGARLFTDAPARARRALSALLACLPACAILAAFVLAWGGLTPPAFQSVLRGGNPATPAFVLALFGVLGVFYAPALWRPLAQVCTQRPALLVGGLLIAAACALISQTTMDRDAGRYGALWSVVERAPVIGGHTSVVILAGALAGALVLLALLTGLARRDRWVMLAVVLGFTAAQSASHMCWQRYVEPLVLIVLALGAASIDARLEARSPVERALRVLGPVLLAAGLLGVFVAGLIGWLGG